jgi:rhodanese-related sulfurtransferase
MSQYLEFMVNHPVLSGAAVALVATIVTFEIRRATRGFADIEPADTTLLINREDAVLIDVRDAAAFAKRHILNARSVPAAELPDQLERLAKHADKPVVVYCDTGISSARAAAALVRAGFKRVHNLKGGLGAWEAAGLPVTKGRK